MSSQDIEFQDIYQQLSVFGYTRNQINEAIQNVTDNLNINSILDYIQNQSTVCILPQQTIKHPSFKMSITNPLSSKSSNHNDIDYEFMIKNNQCTKYIQSSISKI